MPASVGLPEVRRVQGPLEPLSFAWLLWRQALVLGQAHCQRKKGYARHNETQQGEGDQPHRRRLGVDVSSDPADPGQVRAKDRCGAYPPNARAPVLLPGIPLVPSVVLRFALI